MFKTVDKLSLGLNKASARHSVLSNNLANFNTPGFKRSDVQSHSLFAAEMQKQRTTRLRRTNSGHLPGTVSRGSQPFSIITDYSTSLRNDGNNVDADRERVLLLENELYYDSLIDAVSRKLSQLRTVIGEGRR